MLDGGIGHGMVLVERVGAAHPPQPHARGGGGLREIGVLRAVTGVSGAESADRLQVAAVTANDSDQNRS